MLRASEGQQSTRQKRHEKRAHSTCYPSLHRARDQVDDDDDDDGGDGDGEDDDPHTLLWIGPHPIP